jgi:hypothetical protein
VHGYNFKIYFRKHETCVLIFNIRLSRLYGTWKWARIIESYFEISHTVIKNFDIVAIDRNFSFHATSVMLIETRWRKARIVLNVLAEGVAQTVKCKH